MALCEEFGAELFGKLLVGLIGVVVSWLASYACKACVWLENGLREDILGLEEPHPNLDKEKNHLKWTPSRGSTLT